MTIRVMAVIKSKQNLHEVVPDGVFWNWPVVSSSLLDDGGEVAAAAVLHKNVENASIPVDVSIVVAYDVFVVKILEDVTAASHSNTSR